MTSASAPDADPAPLLEAIDLRVTLGVPGGRDVTLVGDVSFSIAAGEKFGLVGESGSGKSLLALALIRLLPPGLRASGRVRFDGHDLLDLTEARMRQLRGAQIGMIFQEPAAALNPVFDLEAQMVAAIRAHAALSRRQARDRAVELLGMVGIPDPASRLGFYPHQLSGGLCQRVMIAMALAGGARLLIADEPTTSLDVTIQDEIILLIERLARETGIAVLFISHDLGVVARLCDRIAVAYAGQIMELGAADALLLAPAHPYTQGLVRCVPDLRDVGVTRRGIPGSPPVPGRWPEGCRFQSRCDFAEAACASVQTLSPLGAGRFVRCWRAAGAVPPMPTAAEATPLARLSILHQDRHPVVVVRELEVVYRIGLGQSLRAVAGISFDVSRGRTLALIGESGSGKSTVARAICGLGPISGGSVTLNGTELVGAPAPAALAGSLGVQVVSQDPGAALDPRWPIWRSIVEPRLARFPADSDRGRERAANLMERVGLDRGMLDRKPTQLSGGQRQRVTIARALAATPQMIILDEAVSALDVSVRNEILALLETLQRESGLTYLLISHDIAAVVQVASDVAVLYLGRLVEQGPAAEVLGRPLHPYTRALIHAVPTIESKEPAREHSIPAEIAGTTGIGCPFRPRCAFAIDRCAREMPPARLVRRQRIACHRAETFVDERTGVLTA
jgi:oligopeptide/dipeptide ABC transporter ATP-binding protein